MSLSYLSFGSYWRNLTSPLMHWHRGTTIHVDPMKDHPEMQVVVAELGADMVVLTMAARITQSIFTLARNLFHKRPRGWRILLGGWRILLGGWRSKVFHALLWMCWKIIHALLEVEVTNRFAYKNLSKPPALYHTQPSMNLGSMKARRAAIAERQHNGQTEEEVLRPRMEKDPENAIMEADCDHKVFCDLVVSRETLLPSCTNPFILAMICIPSEEGESDSECVHLCEDSELSEGESDGDCALTYEEFELSEGESDGECGHPSQEGESVSEFAHPYGEFQLGKGQSDDWSLLCEELELSEGQSDGECALPSQEGESDGECEPPYEESRISESQEAANDSSLAETSEDSGVHDSCMLKSKEDVGGSDWSDEDSWDVASDDDCGTDEDLWASLCRSDDPYNPLSFAMPTRSTKQVKEEALLAGSGKNPIRESCPSKREPQSSPRCRVRKPVLSGFKCSHQCAKQRDELGSADSEHTGKRVRFSLNVRVHHMITWSYAYRAARRGPWEESARDRTRFQKRIAETEAAIGFCLEPRHRQKIRAATINNIA